MNKLFSTLLVCLMCFAFSAQAQSYTVTKWIENPTSTSWWDEGNWTNGVPGANSNVIIPAGCAQYPVLALSEEDEARPTCHFIYFDVQLMGPDTRNSARIQNQHLLTYVEAFADVTIKANRYVRISSPLQAVYTGDYFVKHQTLKQDAFAGTEAAHFLESEYDGNEAKDHPEILVNRSVKGTYYSFYSDYYRICDPYNTYEVDDIVDYWGDPVNGLGTEIANSTSAIGFDVWVNNGATWGNTALENEAMTFHFPSKDNTYHYYDVAGNRSTRADEVLNRKNPGRFVLDANNRKDNSWTFEMNHPGKSAMFAVGNPAFAYMDVAEFIVKNKDNIVPYVYTHNEELGARGTENILYYSYDKSKLYRIGAYEDNRQPSIPESQSVSGATELSKNDRAAYINPAEGFRVLGGSVAFVVDEPNLLGIFTGKFRIAKEVREKYYNLNQTTLVATSLKTTSNGGLSNEEVSMLKDKEVEFRYSISPVTGKHDVVRIDNFLNRGSVFAQIKPEVKGQRGKLVILDNQPIMAVFKGMESVLDNNKYKAATTWDAKVFADYWSYDHTTDANSATKDDVRNTNITVNTYTGNPTGGTASTYTNFTEAYRTMKLHGIAATSAWTFGGTDAANTNAYSVGYTVSNLSTNPSSKTPNVSAFNITNSATTNIELNYTIVDGNVTIELPATQKMFIESDMAKNNLTKPAFNAIISWKNASGSDYRTISDYQCEAWFAYELFTSSKAKDNTITGEFIMPDVFGTYATVARTNIGHTSTNSINCSKAYEKTKVDNNYIRNLTFTRILGSNNTVGITGLYPGDNSTMILGEIKLEGGTYKLRLSPGQLAHIVYDGSDINPAKSHYFYAHGNAIDQKKFEEMDWVPTKYNGTGSTATGYWQLKTKADNNDCYEIMISRQGIQPLANYAYFDGYVYGQYHSGSRTNPNPAGGTSAANFFEMYQDVKGSMNNDVNTTINPDDQPDADRVLKLSLNDPLFVANPTITTNSNIASAAPKRVEERASAPAFISAKQDDVTVTTMIVRGAEASNDFLFREDAPLFGAGDAAFSFGTLAGTQLVGVNAISSLDTLPLFLSSSATLQFANIASLADQVYLYDAVAETTTAIVDGTDYTLEIVEGEQAGRYFLIGIDQAPNGTTDIENVEAFGWKPVAYCPAEGSLSVACAEAVRFEIFNINGQMVGSSDQNTTFNGMSAGVYVVSATRGAEKQSLKVIVY